MQDQRFLDAAVPQHPRAGADGPDRRRGQAGPRRGGDGDPRRRRCAAGCSSTGCRSTTPGSASSSRATSSKQAIADAPSLVLAARPRRRAARRHRWRPRPLRAGLVGAQGARPPDRRDPPRQLDRFRRVRPARRRPGQHPVPRHGLLDQRRHRGQRLRRVAPVHDPDQLEQAGRVRRVHRARRPAHGRDDAALPARPGRPHRPPDGDLHDHRDRQLPVQRGLVPEHDRLRRGGGRGRDRAGHADGADRAGDRRRRHGLPHGRRAGRDHDGPDHPAGRPGPVRRGAGDLPHEDRQLADVGHRGAPARRRVRRGRQVARPADAVVHGPLRRPDPRRPGRRRDVRQRADRGAGRGQFGVRPRDARLPAGVQPAEARLRRRDVRPGAALRARRQAARRPARSAS